TEPGVIICNHPSWGETPAILSVVNRENLKIMVAKKLYDNLPVEVVDKYFFPNNNDPLKSFGVFKRIQDHISQGGVLLIYPSGGNEVKNGADFRGGFRVILQKFLKPDQMVYCFNVNSEDAASLNSRKPGIGLASELFIHPAVNINRARD